MADSDHLENFPNGNNSAVHCPILLKFGSWCYMSPGEGHVSEAEPEVEISGRRRTISALSLSIIIIIK